MRDILVDYAGNGARSVAGFGEVKQEIEDGWSANRKLGPKRFLSAWRKECGLKIQGGRIWAGAKNLCSGFRHIWVGNPKVDLSKVRCPQYLGERPKTAALVGSDYAACLAFFARSSNSCGATSC